MGWTCDEEWRKILQRRSWPDGPGIESRWGARFSASVQTGPGAHPVSYTVGTGYFSGVKRPRRGVDLPPPSSAGVKGRVELYIYSPSVSSWPVIGWTSYRKAVWPCQETAVQTDIVYSSQVLLRSVYEPSRLCWSRTKCHWLCGDLAAKLYHFTDR